MMETVANDNEAFWKNVAWQLATIYFEIEKLDSELFREVERLASLSDLPSLPLTAKRPTILRDSVEMIAFSDEYCYTAQAGLLLVCLKLQSEFYDDADTQNFLMQHGTSCRLHIKKLGINCQFRDAAEIETRIIRELYVSENAVQDDFMHCFRVIAFRPYPES